MLIILYGEMGAESKWKYQRMIDGNATCGYREYARNFGCIVYVTPQKVKLPWENSIVDAKNIIKFINNHPDAVVWSVKHGPKKDRDVLSKIKNRKVYYSCNAKNRCTKAADICLVDTPERLKGNKTQLWVKGKDPEYWKPQGQKKEFDYLLIGQRADKNELYFLNKLNIVKEKRRILWIGGEKHKGKVNTFHDVTFLPFVSQDTVRDNIPRAKVGILFTELPIEGFPQSFVEMAISGVPVVYNINGPKNDFYFHEGNSLLCEKNSLIKNSEKLLRIYDPVKCREVTIKHCSIQRSYQRILECLK